MGDGVVTWSSDGLTVVPVSGTGFTATCGQDSPGGGRSDHIKWSALLRRRASSGVPGFDVPSDGVLDLAATMSGRGTGVDRHPFGSAVADPWSDLRLAAACLVTTDFESHLVFDFALTSGTVYALYERVASPGAGYAAFSYAVPVADRAADQWHDCRIRVDRGGTRVTWLLDGQVVLGTDRLGHRAFGREHLLVDHGGVEETVRLRQLACGLGTFTTLDGAGPDGRGLVRLDSAPDFYYSPRHGAPVAQTFVDDASLPTSRIWGAGAVLRVRHVDIAVEGC